MYIIRESETDIFYSFCNVTVSAYGAIVANQRTKKISTKQRITEIYIAGYRCNYGLGLLRLNLV